MSMKEVYTAQEIGQLLDRPVQSVNRMAKREGWQSRPRTGQGGGFEWLVASMPEITRTALQVAEAAQLKAVATVQAADAPTLPAVPGAPADAVVPDWAFNLATARYRVVTEWRSHSAKQNAKGISKKESTLAFVSAYNAGLMLPDAVRAQVAEISLPTLYRWDAELKKHHDDMLALADRRGKWREGGAKGLGQIGEEAEMAFLKLYLDDNRPTMTMAYRSLATVLEKKELTVPSYTSVRRFFERFDAANHDVVVFMREGDKAYIDTVGSYLTRDDKILEVGDVLVADGHKMNFMMINPETGKPGRFTLVGWQDWASRLFMGFEIMLSENTQVIASSLHNSIVSLGKLPKSVYIDNGKAFKNKFFEGEGDVEEMDGVYLRLGIHVKHSKPYSGRTKIIERWWEDFDVQAARAMESYIGPNIDHKPAHLHRNEKWLKARHSGYVPTIDEVKRMVADFAKWKATQPHPTRPNTTPWEVFTAGRGPGFTEDELGNLARHFMHRKQISPSRCRFTMMGLTFESDVLHGINKKLVAHFSHANLAQVYIFDGDRFLCTARPVESVHPMAELLGSDLDMQTVRAQLKAQAKLRADTRKTAEQIGGAGAELLLGLPHMQGAAERRQPLVIAAGRALEAPEATPTLSDDERDSLTAVVERRKALNAARLSYESPAFFSSELERYDFLFNVCFEQGLTLTPDDAAFMARYEASDEYQTTGRRYEQLRRMYAATAQPLEATA